MACSAGYTIVAKIEQKRKASSRYQIGAGKVRELTAVIEETGAQKVLFDNPLTPVQSYNLAKATGVEAIDRFQLILEIFTRRASTAEAKLQISLAKQQYELAHVKARVRLARLREQPGFMGLGAYEADVYHRAVKRQIFSIRKKLQKIREKRSLHRKRRSELGFWSISLAGYTNAGKSSLFNALTKENVQVEQTLFTTLSTTTRIVEMSKRKILLTDTVGFIDRLPLSLIEAFNSTLEETIYSDLIVLVVDVSEPLEKVKHKNSVCLETINKIGASGVPLITALNKTDLLREDEIEPKLERLRGEVKKPILISALNQTNLDLLKLEILSRLGEYVASSFSVPMTNQTMSIVSGIYNKAILQKIEYEDDSVQVSFRSNPTFAEKVKKQVEELDGEFELEETIS